MKGKRERNKSIVIPGDGGNDSYGVTPPPPGFLLLVQGLRLGAQLHRCCERGIEVALIARLQ
jgi:hypothetical protein